MEEFVTYIMYSDGYRKTYVGFSSSIIGRFNSHNSMATKGYTIRFRPWVVLDVEFYLSKKEAMKREKFLKSGVGRKYIKEVLIPKNKSIGFISA